MNITFYADDPHWSGLDRNGGSRTAILCAKTLGDLGHNVDIVAHKNKFDWFKFKPPVHHVPKNTDALIAVTISDVKHIQKYKGMKLFYYSRPFEIHTKWQKWQMSEKKALRRMAKFVNKHEGTIFCNSGWQVEFLARHGIPAKLVFSGQDLDSDPQPYRERLAGDRYVIGCQYSTKKRKGWEEFGKLAKALGPGYKYIAFGSEKCNDKFLSKYLRNPSREELTNLYREMNYFWIPNKFEGFYNCGVEAIWNGCAIITPHNTPISSGICDYVVADPIMLSTKEAVSRSQNIIKEKIGTREKNMKRMVRLIQNKKCDTCIYYKQPAIKRGDPCLICNVNLSKWRGR